MLGKIGKKKFKKKSKRRVGSEITKSKRKNEGDEVQGS